MQELPKKKTSNKVSMINTMRQWVDSYHAAEQMGEVEEKKKVDWFRVLPFLGVHIACLAVIWVGWSPIAVAVCLALYAVRMFAITGFYHRYFSHRAYKTSRPMQFIFALIGSLAVQRGPLWWAAHHRHHHRYSDTEEDVHSPHRDSFLWSHMFWITARENFPTRLKEVKDLARFPELRFLDRFDIFPPVVLGAAMFFLGVLLEATAPGLGTNGWQMLVWGFFISTVLLFHGTFTINSLSHKFGKARYPTKDESKNSLLLALITFGEGWHNNHHYYPSAARQGFFWYEIDVTYYILKMMSWAGLIWELRPVPAHVRSGEKGKLR